MSINSSGDDIILDFFVLKKNETTEQLFAFIGPCDLHSRVSIRSVHVVMNPV